MPEDLLHQLRVYEEEYPGQPLVAQKADLQVINQLRSRLGMRPVDARLREVGAPAEAAAAAAPEGPPRDHAAARELYEAYLTRAAELEAHRAYADRVARATGGPGQTPVRPLATMGTGGGPLLCDRCGKPMLLEGEPYHGLTADAAWERNPAGDWRSWILGGMVVEIAVNGTLRIYHGYPGRRDRQCCNAARRADEEAQARFVSRKCPETFDRLLAFLEDEFPDLSERERFRLLNEVVNTLFDYDPGIGVNRPDGP
jgi:hypothetical protein